MAQATTKKLRVFELAKTLGLESKLVIDFCRDLGIDVKNQLSSLENEQVDALKQRIAKGGKPSAAPSAPPPRTPTGIPRAEKRLVNIPAPAPVKKADVAPPVEYVPEPEVELEPVEEYIEPVVEPEPIPTPVVKEIPTKIPVLATPKPVVVEKVVEPEPEPEPEPVAEVVAPVVEPTPEPVVVVAPTVEPTPEPAIEIVAPVAAVVPPPEPVKPAPVTPPPAPPAPRTPPMLAPTKPMNLSAPRRPAPATPIRPANPPAQSPPVARTPTPPATPTPTTNPNPTPPTQGARPVPPNTQTRPVPPQGPRPPAQNPVRPVNLGTGRPSTPPGAGQQRQGPPGTGSGPQQRPPVAGGGNDRNRRNMSDRGIGTVARGGQQGPPGTGQRPVSQGPPRQGGAQGPQSGPPRQGPPAAGGRRFTPEELRALREGKGVQEAKRITELSQRPGGPTEEVPEDDDRRKGTAAKGDKGDKPEVKPGDQRAKERQRRTDARKGKVQVKDVVIQGGDVEAVEEHFGSRRGPRAALLKKQRRQRQPGTLERKGKVPITVPITVRGLSEAIGMKATELIFKLKDLTNALFTINSNIEIEVAVLIAEEKGVELDIQKPKSAEDDLFDDHEEASADESKLESRAPVVTIMGHVDHGKTSLLDRIRKTYGIESNVVATEAGGITQVIRAWRVEKDGKPITFLDTPGHEAFTKMRARGANVTDVAVIVVAADSGVQPQTEEAIAHAKAAGVSMVVAINKIDMPGADPTRVERQLYNLSVLPDTMGGDVPFIRTSAVKGTGIDTLLETLALVAELKELKANPHKQAHGTCLEAYLSGDEGVMATFLVQQGTLHRGDVLVCGATYGRVRAMYDDHGRPIKEAGPSVPVRITGLDEVPNADDHFHAMAELSKAREIAEKRKDRLLASTIPTFNSVTLDNFGAAKKKMIELKVILKAEARGSVEAIRKELEKLVHDEVRVRVLHHGIGAITESDVQLALASPDDSIIVGFNVVPDDDAIRLAEDRDIPIREYNIIYKLTEDIKKALEGKLKPEEKVVHLGRAVVRQTFKISKVGTAAGCYVTQGNIERSAKIRVIRDGAVIYPQGEKIASLDSLKRFKDDVREVKEGYDCGMKVAGYDDIKVGDVIEAYRIEQVQRTL